MTGRVIQGFFIGGAVRRQAPLSPAPEARPRHPAGAPAPAFAGTTAPLQARMAPGRPPLVHQGAGHVAQAHGSNGSFEIDPARIGLVRGGGTPLPQALLAKMEAAFGADFSAVRVHVGPQASRIGAVAFTTGNDLYFAPGQFQPGTIAGQQLIGHELAHVIQQRQGRVRAPGGGVAVVQDRMLEAEADRLGMRAAAHVQLKPAGAGTPGTGGQAAAGSATPLQPRIEAGTPAPGPAIQCALTYANSRPTAARGSVHRFSLNGVRYLEDSRQSRWYWHSTNRTWTKVAAGKAPLHNRFKVGQSGRGGPRGASFRSRAGSAASYSDTRRRTGVKRTTPVVPISAPSTAKRTYRSNMRAATMAEGLITTDSATAYAAFFAAPVIVGGYNWCHLIGHGGGGSDLATNIVSASTHANSEQLELERITYRYKRKGVAIRSTATLVNGSLYLARSICVEILFNGTVIFTRDIDGFRSDAPSYIELAAVEVHISQAIYRAAGEG